MWPINASARLRRRTINAFGLNLIGLKFPYEGHLKGIS